MIPALFVTLISVAFFTSTKKLFVQTFTSVWPFKAKEKRTIGKETLKARSWVLPPWVGSVKADSVLSLGKKKSLWSHMQARLPKSEVYWKRSKALVTRPPYSTNIDLNAWTKPVKNLIMITVHHWNLTLGSPLCERNGMKAESGETTLETTDRTRFERCSF